MSPRISHRSGPNVDFTITTTFQTIPGFSITRPWGGGPLLVFSVLSVGNQSGTNTNLCAPRILVDGVTRTLDDPNDEAMVNQNILSPFHQILNLTPGVHRIELQVARIGPGPIILFAKESYWTLIELPEWEVDIDDIDL